MSVTAVIPTKDRYNTTLPLAIMGVINQTTKVDRLIIFDDGEKKDLRPDPLYSYIFKTLDSRGIKWEVAFGDGHGQISSHQKSIGMSETEWIWRIDDDNIPNCDALEQMLSVADEKTGAVGGLVLDPSMPSRCGIASSKMEDIYLGMNSQWFTYADHSEPDHLYSTFIYRKEAAKHGYEMSLSPAGHREETIFTYTMKRNGWDLKINPKAVTLHFRYPNGGIRAHKNAQYWQQDEMVFQGLLRAWSVTPKNYKIIVLNSGLGDHLVFKSILPEIKAKYPNLIMGVCYPEVFEDDNVKLISIAESAMLTNPDDQNVYKYMWDHTDKVMSLQDAYRGLYL